MTTHGRGSNQAAVGPPNGSLDVIPALEGSIDRILIVRPSALGDVCRTVPVLAALRRAYPNAEINWLVRDAFQEAIAHHPQLDAVVPFPRNRLHQWWLPHVGVRAARWLGSLSGREYDLVVDCQGLFRSGLFTWCTRAAHRVGYANAGELGWLGLNHRIQVERELHTVDRMLRLVTQGCGLPESTAQPEDLRLFSPPDAIERLHSDPELAGRRYAVFAPTSIWPGKRWPIERFTETAAALLDSTVDHLDAIVVVGAPGEEEQCRTLLNLASDHHRRGRVIDRVGKTSVGDLLALIEHCEVLLANDSAALHIGVGFDSPLVALFGPTDVRRVGPYGREDCVLQHVEPHDVLDHKSESQGQMLMRRISVEEVLSNIQRQIAPPPTDSVRRTSRAITSAAPAVAARTGAE